MGYDFCFNLLPTRRGGTFPVPFHDVMGDESEEWEFVPLDSLDEARRRLDEFPGIEATGSPQEREFTWERPGGGTIYPFVNELGFFANTHAPWEAVLELYLYLRDFYPDLVIVDMQLGTVHDEESFRRFLAES